MPRLNAMPKSAADPFKLANGVDMPCVGFGTWRIPPGDDTFNAVTSAIAAGYRHFDTAAVYQNEESVGAAVRACGVPRDEIFVTTKLWNDNKTYDAAMKAFDVSMRKLGLDYLDLYLLHWPAVENTDGKAWRSVNREKWRALETLNREGRVRAIGLSNFLPHHIEALMDEADIAPTVNQLEIHVGFPQTETVEFCLQHAIRPQAWSPIARGEVLENPELARIAKQLGKTPAQVSLRWILQSGVSPLPRTQKPARMAENIGLFDFEISGADMEALNSQTPCGGHCANPDERKEN